MTLANAMHSANELFWIGTLASLVAGLGTTVGAVAVLGVRKLSDRAQDALLSIAAGVMLAATFFSLLLPGIDFAEQYVRADAWGVMTVIAGILLGAIALQLIHQYVPHEHFISGEEGPQTHKLKRIWLFVIAITLHNFPEGMAVGVGFAPGDVNKGVALATGIGLQNVPEGLAVATSLVAIGYSRWEAFFWSALTGLVEPLGGAFGSAAAWVALPLLPWVLGFAAGAMLFVISGEIIPETHRGGYRTLATFSLLGGFVLMMFLDVTLA